MVEWWRVGEFWVPALEVKEEGGSCRRVWGVDTMKSHPVEDWTRDSGERG